MASPYFSTAAVLRYHSCESDWVSYFEQDGLKASGPIFACRSVFVLKESMKECVVVKIANDPGVFSLIIFPLIWG